MSAGIAVELFGCAGGMAEGFRRAGVRFDLVVDASQDACASYHANLGHRPVQMDVRDLLRLAEGGWRPPPIWLLVADPPCTPWSRAGTRMGLDDERDMLTATVRLIELWRPASYLIANVPGLVDGPHWPVVQELLGRRFGAAGYCAADFVRLDAADYGVPQHRVRPFWFGHLDGPCLRWPDPTHGAPGQPTLPGVAALRPWVTCRDALAHLAAEEIGRPVGLRRRACRAGRRESVMRLEDPNRPPADPDAQHRAVTAARDQALLDWPWSRPSTVITTRSAIPPPGHHPESGSILSLPAAVVLSERAATLLQGFPDDWVLDGRTKAARWAQIGQAMPPPLAEAVARQVVARATRGLTGWDTRTQASARRSTASRTKGGVP